MENTLNQVRPINHRSESRSSDKNLDQTFARTADQLRRWLPVTLGIAALICWISVTLYFDSHLIKEVLSSSVIISFFIAIKALQIVNSK